MIQMSYTIQNVFLTVILAVCAYAVIKILLKLLQKIGLARKKQLFLSGRIKRKADRKFNKLLNKFKREHKRNPTRNELFRIVINASHITIRRRGHKGHWGRQKVRKYLSEKNHIVKEFTMR